jgi:hypothetical protein
MEKYANGDRCPCCGEKLHGKSEAWLEMFGQLCHASRLEKLESFSPEIQDMDTTLIPPPDAGINPPIIVRPKA